MDLILEKKDVSKSALQQWTTVWVHSSVCRVMYWKSCFCNNSSQDRL